MSDLQIRNLRPDEISLAIDWAAAEGWNPSLADAACFAIPDAKGFFVGEIDARRDCCARRDPICPCAS